VIFGIEISQLLIIQRGKTSLSGNVDNNEHFDLVCILVKIHDLTVDILDLEVEEVVYFI
jgi:hypothetical protein